MRGTQRLEADWQMHPVITDKHHTCPSLVIIKKKAQILGDSLGPEQSLFPTGHGAVTHLSGDMEDC